MLADRFELLDVLGQGSFTITYLAKDRLRGDNCVVKELAPTGSVREGDVLDLKPVGLPPQHLRQRFHDEIRRVGRLHVPSILPVRATFSELGTAFYVIDYIEGTVTLATHVLAEGRLAATDLHEMLRPLFDTLEGMHEKRLVHKDITPDNLLVTPKRRLLLVGPGAAKEWLADAKEAHETFFETPYAPPEETTDRLDRGPATDVYGLAVGIFFALTGTAPPTAMERQNGVELPNIPLSTEADAEFSRAVEAGMALQYLERPQSIGEFRRMLEPDDGVEDAGERLLRLDELIYKMRVFSFERRQCPSCKGVLETPKPLSKNACPVCHDGVVKLRDLNDLACPACGGGVLRKTVNVRPLAICPICKVGRLHTKRKSLLSKEVFSTCEKCDARFQVEGEQATHLPPEGSEQEKQTKTWAEWRAQSERPTEVFACDACEGLYDPLPDGRRAQVAPTPTKWKVLYPEEWAKVASGLTPMAGNAECTACKADFQLDDDRLTLLAAYRDPFGYADRHRGRLLKAEDVRWKGAGKESPNPGLICMECQTEMDFDDEKLRLIRSAHDVLRKNIGQSRELEDWHRLADGLPMRGQEHDFDQEFDEAIAHGYEVGTLSFEEKNDHVIVWRSPATRLQEKNDALKEGRSGILLVTPKEIVFGNRLRKWRMPLTTVVDVSAEDNVLTLIIEDERTPILFELNPVEFTIKLEHTKRTITLNALNLALRLAHEIKETKRELVAAR